MERGYEVEVDDEVRESHWSVGMDVSDGPNWESVSSAEDPVTELKSPGESWRKR